MKKLFFFLSLLSFCATSCITDNTDFEPQKQPVLVNINIVPEKVSVYTRATDENIIADVNVYLFRDGFVPQHLYSTGAQLRLSCLPGKYKLYIVANQHEDMGTLTEASLRSYTCMYRSVYADLPMSASCEITIDGSAGNVFLPAIEVKRQVARIAYHISVGQNVRDIQLKSIEFYNAPIRCALFEGLSWNYSQLGSTDLSSDQASEYSSTCYLFENKQGTVPSITTQRDRNLANAPTNATYILIRAMRGGRVLDYVVFLGENTTDNFDVCRNTSHTLDITILGDNEIDTRVFGYTVDIWTDVNIPEYNGYVLATRNKGLHVDISGAENISIFNCEAQFEEGETEWLTFNGDSSGWQFPFTLTNNGTYFYEIAYEPKVFTEANSTLNYVVLFSDNYSNHLPDHRFIHKYANCLYVDTSGSGTLTSNNALYSAALSSGDHNYMFLCYEKGVTVTASPNANRTFAGWYQDSAFETLISTKNTYTYVPTSCNSTLYAKFKSIFSASTTTLPTTGIAHKSSSFTLTASGADAITATLHMTSGSGYLQQNDVKYPTSVTLKNGSNELAFVPTAIGTVAFSITIKDTDNNSKTFNYSMNVSPLQITIDHFWQPNLLYQKPLSDSEYCEPYILQYYIVASEKMPISANFTYSLTYTYSTATGKKTDSSGNEYVTTVSPIETTKTGSISIDAQLIESKKYDIQSFATECCYKTTLTNNRPPHTKVSFYKQGTYISTYRTYWTVSPQKSPDGTIEYNHLLLHGCQHHHTSR